MKTSKGLPLYEKIGYALGDTASNFVWRGALAFLGVFYTDTFGIPAAAAALLILLVRLSDGVTDILMGMVADRYQSPQGKFRPWVLWSAPALGLFMVLCFSTPDLGPNGKLIYAYITYIGLTLAYTISNVPYSALMGVMTNDRLERTSLSGFRFAGAFLGGVLMTGFLPDLVQFFGNGNQQQGYQYSMFLFAVVLVIMFCLTYALTKERVSPKQTSTKPLSAELFEFSKNIPFIVTPLLAITLFFYYRNVITGLLFVLVLVTTAIVIRKLYNKPRHTLSRTQQDVADLLSNKPWLVLLGVGFLFMMFNGIKQGVIAYYFKYYIGNELMVGQYFISLLLVSIIGALLTAKLSQFFGKKRLFIFCLGMGGLTTAALYWVGEDQVSLLFSLGCLSEFFAAIMPVLFFSMLGDSADYSEAKNGRRATGLIFSAGTFINKAGGGFAGAVVLFVLAAFGYNGMDPATAEGALEGMKLLMSWIPASFAFVGATLMLLYPLADDLCFTRNQKQHSLSSS
ncbi:Inner membrane symporter YicJ [Thalassocella blandensis]|nr:Inner membrane symporter YicJ [Thalassocella blandensis]